MDLFYWNIFCSTYDVQYLNFLSDNAKILLKTMIFNNNFKFKSLQHIIQLHLSQSWKNIISVDYLSKIKSLTYHTKDDYLSKKIYIFGGYNNNHNNCGLLYNPSSDAIDFIFNNVINEPKFIDVFSTHFENKEYKEHKNVKFHIINNRKFTVNKINNLFIMTDPNIIGENKKEGETIQDIISYGFKSYNENDNLLTTILQTLDKQTKKILLDHLYDNIKLILKERNYKEINKQFVYLYLISSLFYSIKEKYTNEEKKNIIIICNETDAKNYRLILKKIQFKLQNSSINNKSSSELLSFRNDSVNKIENCINIKNFNIPLFT